MSDRELLNGILSELAIATRHDLDDQARAIYCDALAHWDIPTLSEACARLMQSSKYFPKVAEVNEVCGVIRKEARADESEALYSRREWLQKPRATLWLEHLRETLQALRQGRRRPVPPEPLDTTTPTFQCRECQDTGFIHACDCGDCRLCQFRVVKDCYCRPARSEPVKTVEKRNARAR